MAKIMVLAVSENEEHVFQDIQSYLKLKTAYADLSFERNMTLSFPNLKINLYHREIRKNERVIKLTDLEFRLLLHLARQPGRVFTYQQIYEAVWGEEYAHEKGTIMSHICHIRKKLESDGKPCDYIENIRGVGYRFKEHP
jgi:DNA-binding response OmpR family regulator